jgi:hypothetical protein
MEQASKRSSSHEGGLLLDPLHKGSSLPLMAKDREGRQRRVSAQRRSSVSSFPPPVVRHLAAPEPEIPTGNPSHYHGKTTSSDQTTELLLKQLMSEMKYLRERVDTFPTGPVQEVATGLQTSDDIREPSSQSSSSEEEMEVDEQTMLPCIPHV